MEEAPLTGRPRPPAGLLPVPALLPALLVGAQGPRGAQLPGKQSREVTLLPNGWRISPAGRHLTVGDLPLAMLESADGRHIVVSSNGWMKPTLTVVDVRSSYVKSRRTVDRSALRIAG